MNQPNHGSILQEIRCGCGAAACSSADWIGCHWMECNTKASMLVGYITSHPKYVDLGKAERMGCHQLTQGSTHG